MADNKSEREYVIPLRRVWRNVPFYERTGKAIKTIKIFVAKHMKVEDRDVKNVKLDIYFNNELWFKGRASPPAKIKVKVKKENGIVHVTFADMPKYVEHLKRKHGKIHKKAEEPKEKPAAQKEEAKTEEQKQDEKEKEKSTAEAGLKEAKIQTKVEKHTTKIDKATSHPQRMALKK